MILITSELLQPTDADDIAVVATVSEAVLVVPPPATIMDLLI